MNKTDYDVQDTTRTLVSRSNVWKLEWTTELPRISRRQLMVLTGASMIALAMVAMPAKVDPNTYAPAWSVALAADQDRDRAQDQVDEPDQDQDQTRDCDDGDGPDQDRDRDHAGAS
jgi:hypothetical protein